MAGRPAHSTNKKNNNRNIIILSLFTMSRQQQCSLQYDRWNQSGRRTSHSVDCCSPAMTNRPTSSKSTPSIKLLKDQDGRTLDVCPYMDHKGRVSGFSIPFVQIMFGNQLYDSLLYYWKTASRLHSRWSDRFDSTGPNLIMKLILKNGLIRGSVTPSEQRGKTSKRTEGAIIVFNATFAESSLEEKAQIR